MKEFLRFAVMVLIILSKMVGFLLILTSLINTATLLFFLGQENPELIGAFRWAEFWNRITPLTVLMFFVVIVLPTLFGVWLIKIPTLKMWEGPGIKFRDKELA